MDKDKNILGGNAFKMWLIIHIFSWITQFIGHGLFEKRAPALLTNFLFIYLAPFFTIFEYLHLLFAYRNDEVVLYNKIALADIMYNKNQRS